MASSTYKCPYCNEELKEVAHNNKIFKGDVKGEYVCDNQCCDFQNYNGYPYRLLIFKNLQESDTDGSKLTERVKRALERLKVRWASMYRESPIEKRMELIKELTLAFKPDFTIWGLRIVKNDEVDFEANPCVSNVQLNDNGEYAYKDLMCAILQDKINGRCELKAIPLSALGQIPGFPRIPFQIDKILKDNQKEKLLKQCPIGAENLKTLFIGVIDGKNGTKMLLEGLLPYDTEYLNQAEDLFKSLLKIGEDGLAVGEKCEWGNGGKKCQGAVNGLCGGRIFYSLSIEDPGVRETMEKLVERLEETLCRKLKKNGIKRNRVWTLQLFMEKDKDKYFKFVLPKKKEEELWEQIGNKYLQANAKFNEDWKAFQKIKHPASGIMGSTITSYIPEIIPNAWSDRRLPKLVEELGKMEEGMQFREAEARFYPGRENGLNYTLIPLIIDKCYWGALMIFEEMEGKFSADEFYEKNCDLLASINEIILELKSALISDFLTHSAKELAKSTTDSSSETGSLKEALKKIMQQARGIGFLPDIYIYLPAYEKALMEILKEIGVNNHIINCNDNDIDNMFEVLRSEGEDNQKKLEEFFFTIDPDYRKIEIYPKKEETGETKDFPALRNFRARIIFCFKQCERDIPINTLKFCEDFTETMEAALKMLEAIQREKIISKHAADATHTITRDIIPSLIFVTKNLTNKEVEIFKDYLNRRLHYFRRAVSRDTSWGSESKNLIIELNKFKTPLLLFISYLERELPDLLPKKLVEMYENMFDIKCDENEQQPVGTQGMPLLEQEIEVLYVVMENLIGNAFKHNLRGENLIKLQNKFNVNTFEEAIEKLKISISCFEEQGNFVIKFSDNGIGFPKEITAKAEEWLSGRILPGTDEGLGLYLIGAACREVKWEIRIYFYEDPGFIYNGQEYYPYAVQISINPI
jgi:signal transduction histidine kinase